MVKAGQAQRRLDALINQAAYPCRAEANGDGQP
jgi:hypothetical protein